jgi:hypothetical protein
MPTRPAFTPDWSEGRYFDRWMLVHFISGIAGGFSNRFFDLSTPMVFVVALAVMGAWELGEWIAGVGESWTNALMDIAIGCGGVALALGLAPRLTPRGEVVAFGLTLAVALVGSVQGWRVYRRRRLSKP